MKSKLIAAGLVALASGTAAATTSITTPNATDAFIGVVGQSAFESVIRVTQTVSDGLMMSFSATNGAFENVSYTFYTDAGLTTTITGDDWSVWTIDDKKGKTSFTTTSELAPFVAAVFSPELPIAKDTPYFVKFAGNVTSPAGELKVTVINAVVTAVPEPEAYAMLLAGLGLMGTVARRRNKAKAS